MTTAHQEVLSSNPGAGYYLGEKATLVRYQKVASGLTELHVDRKKIVD